MITREFLKALWSIDPDIQVRVVPGEGAVFATVVLERIVGGEHYVYAQHYARWEMPDVVAFQDCLLSGARFLAEKARAALEAAAP